MSGSDVGAASGETTIRLHSDGLLSKWGFNDGDMPDKVFDAVEATGIPSSQIEWRRVLCDLVRAYLLPQIDQQVTVYEISTSHNPIRAEYVDGAAIDDTDININIRLTPEYVDVPIDVVFDAIRRSGGTR